MQPNKKTKEQIKKEIEAAGHCDNFTCLPGPYQEQCPFYGKVCYREKTIEWEEKTADEILQDIEGADKIIQQKAERPLVLTKAEFIKEQENKNV